MMDAAIDFMHRYLLKEYDTGMMMYTAEDYFRFEVELYELQELCLERVASSFRRPVEVNQAWLDAHAEKADRLSLRTIFLIRHLVHPSQRDVFAFYLSDNDPDLPMRRLRQCLYVAELGSTWLAIARYGLCDRCHGTGKLDGTGCADCQGAGWRHEAGKDLSGPVQVRETRIMDQPPHPEDREAWEALVKSVP